MIRALHLCANHKVTGPAELALDTALAVERHAAAGEPEGRPPSTAVESRFIAGWHPRDPFWLGDLAIQRGARLVRLPGCRLAKHFNPVRAWRDARRLARYLESEPADLIHCHLPNDHLIAALAGRLGRQPRPPIVRTLYDGEPPRAGWRERWTLRGACDRLVCLSERVAAALEQGPLAVPPQKVVRLDPPVDTDRFHPGRRAELPDLRARWGIPAGAFVAGIVARMQTHRRFEVLLEAIRRARSRIPEFRFVVIGRGTHQEAVAREPARRLGIADTVIFAGYLTGDDFAAALLAFDLKVFLVPGSDGSCRAVREALAAGIPALVARRGMLPELVEDGISGRVIDDTTGNLADALVDLAGDRDRLRAMGAAARRRAEERFGYVRYAKELHAVYDDVLRGRPGAPRRAAAGVR